MSDERIARLEEELKLLYMRKAGECMGGFSRLLPFSEMLVDRWEKARLLQAGEGTSVHDSCMVYGEVSIGRNVWVGPYTILDGSGGGLVIGDNCSISAGVHIYTHDSVAWAVSGGASAYAKGPVRIGSRVYIGPQCVITRGVTVGDGAVIGALSLVNRDVEPGVAAWGSPARPRGRVVLTDDGRVEVAACPSLTG